MPNWPPPMVVCTVSTPSISSSASSLSVAFSEDCSRLVPAGRVWVSEAMFCPVSPRKLMFTSGIRNTVPTSTRIEAPTVIRRRGSVSSTRRSTGAYIRCSQVLSSLASARSRAAVTCAGSSGSTSSWPFGGFRNQ